MDKVDEDLKEVMQDLKGFSKIYQTSIKDCNEYKTKLKIITDLLKASQESEENVRLKQKKCQENLMELQNILSGYINIKEENESLKIEMKKAKELLELERTNYSIEKDKWSLEKENLMKTYSAEIQNLKTLRNMEVSSLNREIDSIHEENDRKIEMMKNAIENDYKNQMSRTIANYEERMAKLSRELISAQSELNNLRQANEDNVFNEVDKRERHRYIPQPLPYGRYRPLIPIVTKPSQMCKTLEEGPEVEKSPSIEISHEVKINNESPKKKRKLYTRTDDLLY